jgi:hypothetical protein
LFADRRGALLIAVVAGLAAIELGLIAWAVWNRPRSPKLPDQWRRYRGIMVLRKQAPKLRG